MDDPEYDVGPQWSPDGRKILFTTGRNGNFDVYETNADGTGQRNLTADNDKADGAPIWSIDGHNIAFSRRFEGKDHIFVMDANGEYHKRVTHVIDADGSNLRMVTRSPHSTFVPKWSADGAKITFVIEYHGARANIFEIPAEGGNLKRLTAGPKFDGRPAYSPDGTKLAFESNRNGNYEIYVMSLC